MRRLHFATLLFSAISILSIGCRQTSGPSAAGSMSPAAQSPTFNPFGGATRVTPPPGGTSAAQNPYIGGPPGQTNTAVGVANGFAAAAVPGATAPVVGSGVQPAGFVHPQLIQPCPAEQSKPGMGQPQQPVSTRYALAGCQSMISRVHHCRPVIRVYRKQVCSLWRQPTSHYHLRWLRLLRDPAALPCNPLSILFHHRACLQMVPYLRPA